MSSLQYTLSFYVQALERFIQTGECARADSDALYAYLLSVMNDPMIRVQVLSSDVCARVFYDTMLRFVQQSLDDKRYNLQKSQSELKGMELVLEWSLAKKKYGWQALIQEIDSKYQRYGFDCQFYQSLFSDGKSYADTDIWEKMVNDWREAFQRKQQEEHRKNIEQRKDIVEKRMRASLKSIPEYLSVNGIDEEEFFQAWGLMDGIWNTVDFERLRKVVRIQKEYPEILKVAQKMGRIAEDDGKERLMVSQGQTYRLEHSSMCDIAGITVGNDLNALLPSEWVQCADEELEALFVYKYLTGKLQNFRYKSEIMQPSRRLEFKPSVSKGPMIVCLDTSGSMVGKPEKIASSLMIKLLEIADRQKRDCYLIAFSVSIRPIDVRKERMRLLDFFSSTSCGDTNATRMLEEVFRLLQSSRKYMNADVLWISDFKIPHVSEDLLDCFRKYRLMNTRFYGLQVGTAKNHWENYFDNLYKIDYSVSRKY